jgi:hypothetical protein
MVITPRIVGRSVGLAPLEVILTMMAAGSLFGFLGVLLAVPLGAVAKILIQRAVKAYLASGFYNKPPEATLAGGARSVVVRPAGEAPISVTMPGAPAAGPSPSTTTAQVIIAKGKT